MKEINEMNDMTGMTEHVDNRLPGVPIYYVSNHRPDPDSMVVLMPSALTPSRADRSVRTYHRWSWQLEWPTSLVIAVFDPAMQQAPGLEGAWYIHPGFDVVAAISGTISDLAARAGVPTQRIVFYGSSLGGFGAIGCAAHLPGSRAVAEVPQIDVERWIAGPVKAVEQHITHGPISEFRKFHPERISLRDRLSFAGLVPPITIVSNRTDRTIADQRAFVAWCQEVDLPRLGEQRLTITDRVKGHKALDRQDAVGYVLP